MEVSYSPSFIKALRKCPKRLQEEALERVDQLHNQENHHALKVHKLRGRLKNRYSFSVNYSTQIIFCYTDTTQQEAYLLDMGSHDVYDR